MPDGPPGAEASGSNMEGKAEEDDGMSDSDESIVMPDGEAPPEAKLPVAQPGEFRSDGTLLVYET